MEIVGGTRALHVLELLNCSFRTMRRCHEATQRYCVPRKNSSSEPSDSPSLGYASRGGAYVSSRGRSSERLSSEVGSVAAISAAAVVAVLPLAVVTSLAVGLLARSRASGPQLADYRVGSLVWFGAPKSGEALQLTVLLGVLVLAALLAVRTAGSGARDESGPIVPPIIAALAILASPAVVPFLIGAPPGLSVFPGRDLALVLALQAVPALHHGLSWLRSRGASGERGQVLRLEAPLVLAGLSVAALGLLVVLRYTLVPRSLSVTMHFALLVGLLISIAALTSSTPVKVRLEQPHSHGWIVTVAALAALPLLLPPLMVRDGSTVVARGVDYRAWAVMLFALGAAAVLETWWRSRPASTALQARLASLSVALLIVPLRAEHAWPTVSNDDFHFGEVFVPFKAWLSDGAAPYIDFALVRGVVPNMLPSALNQLVGDGTAAVYAYGLPLAAVLVMTVSHLLLRSVVGVGMATAMIALFGLANHFAEADLLIFAVMVRILGWLRRPGGGALPALGIVAAVALGILAYPLMGLAVGLTIAGVGLSAALGGLLSRSAAERQVSGTFVIALLAGSLTIAASPLRPYLSAALRYVVDNARANEEAHAIALDLTLMIPSVGRIAPFMFVVAGLVSLGLIFRSRALITAPSWDSWLRVTTAAVPLILVVGLFGRFAGRVDPGEWSYRPSAGAVVLLGVALPAVLVLTIGSPGRRSAWWSIGGAAVIAVNIHPLGGVLPSALGMVPAPYTWTSSSDAAIVPLIGHGQGDPAHLEELAALARATELLGSPTVANLTNRNALDAYFGWTSPMRTAAPYNLESTAAEIAAIARLRAASPELVLLSPGEWHESMSMSLRTPHLARHLMEDRVPFLCEGWTWAASNPSASRAPAATSESGSCVPPTDANQRTALWSASIGAPEWLAMAPLAWGSWGPLGISDAEQPIRIKAVGAGSGRAIARIPSPPSQLRAGADILLIESSCPSRPDSRSPSHRDALLGTAPSARLIWAGPSDAISASAFFWGVGRFAIPLDAYPSWHRHRSEIEEFRLELPSGACQDGWLIDLAFVPRPMPR